MGQGTLAFPHRTLDPPTARAARPPRERGKCNGDSLSCGPTGGHPDKPLTGGRMFKEGQLAVFHQAMKGPRALCVPLAARGVARLFKLWDACCQAPKRLACLL